MTIQRILLLIATAWFAGVASLAAQTPYDEGQKALRESRWMEAAAHFAQAQDSAQADAAMYWRAHALYRAGHRGDAARQLEQLARRFPDSSWNEEARALKIEFEGGEPIIDEEDRLRLFALSHLIERDRARAMPLIVELMKNTPSESVRRDALFLLGMSELPEAQRHLADAARDADNPELQAAAIEMLAVAGTDFSLSLLGELYDASADRRVRAAVIRAHIVADSTGPLMDMLRAESDPALQREIIHGLGAMDAVSEIRSIWPELKDPMARRAAIEAFAIAEDSAMLRRVLAEEDDPMLRQAALHGLAVSGDENIAGLLVEMYDQARSVQEKRVILDTLVVLDDASSLALRILETEDDPALKGMAIDVLGLSGDTATLADLYQRLEEVHLRRRVLDAMMVAGDTESLRRIIEQEENPELRASAIHALSLDGGEDIAPMLMDIYRSGEERERRAVIESLMIMEHDQALIDIARQEQDPGLRRQVIHALGGLDTDAANEYLFSLIEQGL
ncbi:MAG: HEAT repeat domain-containing protein [Xanthomonadales bacterium]|nr:HEAT repeat domain-containing protein [Xanthomonadales bacterium]